MDNFLNSGIQFILRLQSLGGWLAPVMKLFTFLGNEMFYLMIAPAILWCIDSTLGMRLGLFLMINGTINAVLKIALHDPRPYWFSNKVTAAASTENSFGAPSGHAQNAVVVWGTLAYRIKTRWAWIIAGFIIFMIGISRIFLAMHFPQDVLLGWLFGILVLWLMVRLEKPVLNWFKKYSPPAQVVFVFLFSMAMILLVLLSKLTLGSWTLPATWVNNALISFPNEPPITPLSINNILAAPATFFGLAAGWIWITLQGGFTVQDVWWKLLLRYFFGLLGVVILYMGLGSLFPSGETITAYVLKYIRYALIGFWMSGFAPWLFVKLKLANHPQALVEETAQAGV
jgi:membrane-associated phospholipid phosphatase